MSRLEKNKESFKSVLSRIKASLQTTKWREAFTFFIFLLLAAGFWLMQSLQQEYEVEMNIPIRYRNIPSEVAFTSPLPDKVNIRIKDKGTGLINYVFWNAFMPIDINLKDLPVNKTRSTVADRKKIESDIQKQLLSTTALLYTEPTSIDAVYGKLKEKEVPVIFNGMIETKPGFQLVGKATLSPEKVILYANQATIDSVSNIKTEFKQLTKIDKTQSVTVKLQKPEGSSLSEETVTLTIPIEEFTEKVLSVPVICSNLPSNYELKTFPSSVNVSANVSMSKFNDLDAFVFEIDIPFESLKDNKTGTVKLELTKQPDWVSDTAINPNTIEFILEQKSSPSTTANQPADE